MATVPYSARGACRLCQRTNMVPILSLGTLYVSGFLTHDSSEPIQAPLELVLCNRKSGGCGMLQLRHTVTHRLLYRYYWYRSVTNESMQRELAEIAHRSQEIAELRQGDLVVDIGCNDGTLLRSYKVRGLHLGGFDPAENLTFFAKQGTDTIVNDYFTLDGFRRAFGTRKANVMTTIAMFYDLDDPGALVSDVAASLDSKGVWINQMAYLPLMLERNAFDNICHEHLGYYSLAALQNLYGRHQLEIFDVELNEVNGGSFRIFARHKDSTVGTGKFGRARVEGLERFEEALGLDDRGVYDRFARRVEKAKSDLVAFLEEAVASGKKVYGYGASTKGNTLLQYFGLSKRLVSAIADRNSEKWGKQTVGTDIPIISEEQARKEHPDYFLVLPWHFLAGFQEREREYLSSGGRFVVPLPTLRIIGAS